MELVEESGQHLEDDLTSRKKNQNEVGVTYSKRPYPVKVFSTIAMEFCERFAFYGLRTILVLYLRNVLEFSDSSATITFHIFACLCYFTPLFGAILADVFLDKYKTILYLSMIHLLGDFTLAFSATVWNYPRIPSILAFAGLFMISIGAGGIKPCVSALGGDQFSADEEKWRNQFFPIFFLSIELGWVVSMFTVPILRTNLQCVGRSDCYPAAFGAPCTLMLIAIICFVLARKKYHLSAKPDKSIIVMFFKCLWLASKRRIYIFFDIFKSKLTLKSSGRRRSSVAVDRLKNTEHWLYLASDKFDKQSISNFVSLLGLITLLLPIQLHYCLLDQQASLWTLQANRMDGRVLNTNFIFDPDQIGLVSPLINILAIPILELGIYPCFARFGVETSPLQRMTIGGLFTSFSYVSSALIENRIDSFLPMSEPPLGKTNLVLINGLRRCSIELPTITYMQKAKYMVSNSSISRIGGAKRVSRVYDNLERTGVRSIDLLSSNSSLISYYRFSFELKGNADVSKGIEKQSCSYNNNTIQNFNFRPLADKRVKLLYLKGGDQKLELLMFNDTLELPLAGRARVRLLYDGAYDNGASEEEEEEEEGRQFSLVHKASASHPQASRFQFRWSNNQHRVLLSNHIDVDVPTRGEKFSLQTNDKLLSLDDNEAIYLKPGTRNLIIIQQIDLTKLEINHKVLQDNDYRISMLYQLFPYTFISLGNVMLSMTGLSFCYSSAPNGMQPVILGVFYSMNGFGNMLTVIVDTMFTFQNDANRYIFFASLMALAMILFSYLGYKFEPRKP